MRYKNIGLRTIAMMIAISVVCTSVPVYAEEIEEYITETSDSGSGSDSDSSDNNSDSSSDSESNNNSDSSSNSESNNGSDSSLESSTNGNNDSNQDSSADSEAAVETLVVTIEETSDSSSNNTSEEVADELTDNEEQTTDEIVGNGSDDKSEETEAIAPDADEKNGGVYNQTFEDLISGEIDTYTKTIESISTSKSSTGRYNANFVITEKNDRTGVEKTYNYTVSGFTSAEAANKYIDTFVTTPVMSGQLAYGIIQDGLVDAEKRPWKYDEKDGEASLTNAYDSQLCWAGTTSNMLELSGWNKIVNIANEDKVMDLYADTFTDAAGNPFYGLNWFFDGYYQPERYAGWAHLKNVEDRGNGFLKEYCIDDLAKRDDTITETNLTDILKRLDKDSDGDRCALGVVFGHYVMKNGQHVYDENGEWFRDGGHVVTIVGYSTDENGIPNTITIADSDSYNGETPNYSKDNDRTSYPNTYNTYPIEYYDGCWHIMNYLSNEWDNIIDGISTLKYYSDSTKDNKDMYGTHDVVNYPDFKIFFQNVFQDYNYNQYCQSVYQGETLRAGVGISNYSYYSDNEEHNFTYRFIVTKDGEVVRTLDYMDILDYIDNTGKGMIFFNNIMDEDTPLEPGEYTVSFIVNYDRSITEAYYNNNESDTKITFIVLKRVDENGDVHYVVVPNEEVNNNTSQEEYKEIVSEFVRNVYDYTVVTDHSSYINDVNKVFEFELSNVIVDSNATDDQIQAMEVLYDYSVTGDMVAADGSFGGTISSNIVITKDDFHIERNADGSWKLVFTNEFMRNLPKGTHYFKIKIGGKVHIFKIEVI